MDYVEFVASLEAKAPPVSANVALRALWYDANDRGESAMRAALSDDSYATMRARAYLHRKAGDEFAAQKCYWLSGASAWVGSLPSEWEDIARSIMIETIVENSYL